jgi:tetratricopeptide (TPR) repeat protein
MIFIFCRNVKFRLEFCSGGRSLANGVRGFDTIRDIAYTLLGAARRRMLHRRALEVLRDSNAPAVALARHAQMAGETDAAFAYLVAAGDAALAVYALHEALDHYEAARQMIEDAPVTHTPFDVALQERLYCNSGRAYEATEQWDKAQTSYEALRQLGQEQRRADLEGSALNRLAVLAMLQTHDVRRAQAFLHAARSVAAAQGAQTLVAETEWNLAHIATLAWESSAAFDHGQRALTLARDLGDTELTARCLLTLGEAKAFAGRWEESIAPCEEARQLYAALAADNRTTHPLVAQFIFAGTPTTHVAYHRAMEALCLRSLAVGAMHLGDVNAGIDAGRTALAISRDLRNPFAINMTLISLAHGLDEVGSYHEALALASEAITTSATIANPQQRFWALLRHAITDQHILDLDAASARLEEAQALAEQRHSPVYQLKIAAHRGVNAALRGDWSRAYSHAREAAALRETMQNWLLLTDFERHHEVTALLHGGDAELAHTQIQRLATHGGSNHRFRLVLLRMQAAQAE